jgi:mono/diheme cytochrome c family protein
LRSIARILSFFALLLAVFLLAGCSLASPAPVGQVSSQAQPPPAAQQSASANSPESFQLPSRRPSAAEGAAIYQQKCVRCHGELGRGDGAMAAQIQTQFGSPVADLTSDVTARAQTPEQWYAAVSNGNLQKGMPPFSGSLSPDQRWDVIAYAWSLSTSSNQMASGKAVYQDQCAHCHGDQGKGNGKDASGKLSDLSDFAALAKVAPGLWDQALASGHVPSFAGTLSEGNRRAAIDYVRTFAYDAAASSATGAASATTPSVTPGSVPSTTTAGSAEPTKIEGMIVNGTAGQTVPDNLPLTLYILPHQGTSQDMITRTFQSGVNGHFVITDAQADSSSLVAVGVDYKDLSFYSEVAPAQLQVTLPITIYESTADTAQVKIDTLHMVVEPSPAGLSVSEIYVLSNNGDRMVAGFGQPVLHFGLPAAATDLQIDPTMQSVLEPRGDGLDYFDAIPVGQQVQSIVYQYTLPVTATSLSRAIYHPIALANLLLGGQASNLTVTSDQLESAGTQTIPAAPNSGQPNAQTFQQYTAAHVQPGQTLNLSIGTSVPPFDWRILLGVALVVVGVVGVIIWRRSQQKQPAAASARVGSPRSAEIQREVLIDQIAALDDEFAEGKLDEINYKAKRAKLKEKLMKLMDEE